MKRYNIEGNAYKGKDVIESENGEWVRYEDVEEFITRMRKKVNVAIEKTCRECLHREKT